MADLKKEKPDGQFKPLIGDFYFIPTMKRIFTSNRFYIMLALFAASVLFSLYYNFLTLREATFARMIGVALRDRGSGLLDKSFIDAVYNGLSWMFVFANALYLPVIGALYALHSDLKKNIWKPRNYVPLLKTPALIFIGGYAICLPFLMFLGITAITFAKFFAIFLACGGGLFYWLSVNKTANIFDRLRNAESPDAMPSTLPKAYAYISVAVGLFLLTYELADLYDVITATMKAKNLSGFGGVIKAYGDLNFLKLADSVIFGAAQISLGLFILDGVKTLEKSSAIINKFNKEKAPAAEKLVTTEAVAEAAAEPLTKDTTTDETV